MIENGKIIFGIVEKKTVGASQDGLVYVVFCEKGPDVTRLLFTSIQMVINFWLFHNGFSISIGDIIVDQKTMAYITQHIAVQAEHHQYVDMTFIYNNLARPDAMYSHWTV